MQGIDAQPTVSAADAVRFQLQYTAANKNAWSQLFGKKISGSENGDKITVAVGLSDGSQVTQDYSQHFSLEFLPNIKAKLTLGVSLVMVALTVMLSRYSSMLRDSSAPRTDGRLGTYSLGRTQMAVWFATIVFAFLFIYSVTGVAHPSRRGLWS